MAKQEVTGEKKKKSSRAGIVILVLLLILGGAAGYLYFSVVKAPLELDDPGRMAAAAGMSVEERFQFSQDQSLQLKLDTGDIWHLILANTGENFLDEVNDALTPYGLSVSGCAIRLGEEGLRLDMELYYNNIRIVTKVPCALEVADNQLRLNPTAVKLGAIALPVGKLLSDVEFKFDLELPVLGQVNEVSFVPDAVVLTGPMEDLYSLVPQNVALAYAAVFSEKMQDVAYPLQTQEGYEALIAGLCDDPSGLEDLYRGLFTLADPEVTEAYLLSRRGLTQRFFPGIDFENIGAEQAALSQELGEKSLVLEKFFTNLVNDFNEKKFRLSDGEFILNWRPFDVVKYAKGKYDALFESLDPESVFLILVDAENGFIRKTSSFYRMADEKQQFTQEVDFNKTYILGCVLRSVAGDPFLMYEIEVKQSNTYSRNFAVVPLTEETVSQLQQEGKFGVWTNK